MRTAFAAALLIGAAGLPGCVIVQSGVKNPIPGLTTVAVAPFVNLSAERSVDGRRFALAYHAELQKIPGYQVIPVGVTEQAILDLGLDLDGPEDSLTLARALGADAVVIGAVTDYDPYYPPRIGLQVSWYSPEPWRFVPGIPIDPGLDEAVQSWRFARRPPIDVLPFVHAPGERVIIRAQTPDECLDGGVASRGNGEPPSDAEVSGRENGPLLVPPSGRASAAQSFRMAAAEQAAPSPSVSTVAVEETPPELVTRDIGPETESAPWCPPSQANAGLLLQGAHDPRQPVMSYTRLFDGSDSELTALLRDYVVLSGDLRSGGWEAYLHRTDDFMRFTAHRMIVEMLTLHGGESKRRYVWLLRPDRH